VITQQGTVDQAEDERSGWQAAVGVRYRLDGRGSVRPRVGGFATQGEALQALQIALERLHRRNGRAAQIALGELVAEYLAQHGAAPRTIAKLRWLLEKATGVFGERRIVNPDRMRSPPGVRGFPRGIASRPPRRCDRC
jgi:hypothetical protein